MKPKPDITMRKALVKDEDAIWHIIEQVIARGDTYAFTPDTPRESMMAYWCSAGKFTYVAETDGRIAGTFVIQENQPGLGNHVANAAFMTDPEAAGRGVGTAMGIFALQEARRLGFRAMQFNYVIKTNTRAVLLWKKLGFEIVGEVREAFRKNNRDLTDVLIMWKKL